MNDSEFERLLKRKYAQVVLKALLDAEGNRYAFSALRAEVNAIIADDSRGAKELKPESEEYSSASLSSLLSDAKKANLVIQYLNDDGKIRWRLRPSELSPSQVDQIRSRTGSNTVHADTASIDLYPTRHTDSGF